VFSPNEAPGFAHLGWRSLCWNFAIYRSSPNAAAKQAIAYPVQDIDAFFIAPGFMVFSSGVYNLFIRSDGNRTQMEASTHAITSIAEVYWRIMTSPLNAWLQFHGIGLRARSTASVQ
jgi:hypothetical protein